MAALGLARHALGISVTRYGLAYQDGEPGLGQGTAHFRLRGEYEGVLDAYRFPQNRLKETLGHYQGAGMDAAVVVRT